MENKINLVELLKYCPTGMELDCTMYNKVTLLKVDTDDTLIFPITIVRQDGNLIKLTKYGQYANVDFAKCIIFPKGKTTWEGFQIPFKDGDIVATSSGIQIFILQKAKSNNEGYCYIGCYFRKNNRLLEAGVWGFDRLATEDEKEKLFKAIKDNGYRWDTKNKTLEKLPMFKVGDKIKLKGGDEFGIITEVADCYYTIQCKNNTHCWSIKKQDDWELINEPKFKVGDRIQSKNNIDQQRIIKKCEDDGYWTTINSWIKISNQDKWELVPNKFDINTLVPFESRVLVRDIDHYEWEGAIFGRYDGNSFFTIGGTDWKYCIPYEGNEHLLGTTDDCDEYFKLIS